MRKILALVLALGMILGMLSGCSKEEPYEAMGALMSDMQDVEEGEINLKMGLELFEDDVTSDIIAMLGDKISFEADGTISVEEKQLQATVDLSIPNMGAGEVTDLMLDGNDMYVNMETAYTWLYSLMGMGDDSASSVFESVLEGNSYVVVDMESDVWEDTPSDTSLYNADLLAMMDSFSEIITEKVKEANAVTEKDGVYTMTLEGDLLEEILIAILEDIDDNYNTYFDAIMEAVEASLTTEDMAELGEDMSILKTQLRGMIGDAKDWLEKSDMSGVSYVQTISYDDSDKTYAYEIIIKEESLGVFTLSETLTETSVKRFDAPLDALPMDQFTENTETLDLYGTGGDSSGNGGTDTVDTEMVYETVISETPITLLNQNISGSAYFMPQTLKDSAGIEYTVPLLNASITVPDERSAYAHMENIGQNYYLYNTPTQTAAEFMIWYVGDEYDYYAENGTNHENSSLRMLEDGSAAFMAFRYEDDNYGPVTLVYCAVSSNDNLETIFMELQIYTNDVTEAEAAAISELGQIMGVDLGG